MTDATYPSNSKFRNDYANASVLDSGAIDIVTEQLSLPTVRYRLYAWTGLHCLRHI